MDKLGGWFELLERNPVMRFLSVWGAVAVGLDALGWVIRNAVPQLAEFLAPVVAFLAGVDVPVWLGLALGVYAAHSGWSDEPEGRGAEKAWDLTSTYRPSIPNNHDQLRVERMLAKLRAKPKNQPASEPSSAPEASNSNLTFGSESLLRRIVRWLRL